METTERVTVTLPETVVREIDRQEPDRSRFVREAVQRELDRRRRQALRTSVENAHVDHPELVRPDGRVGSLAGARLLRRKRLAEAGFDEWASLLPAEDAGVLVDASAGRPVRWVHGSGWTESGT